MYDVVALGELLIDFTPAGKSENGNPLFECNPGGAPANVLACLAQLGKKTAFVGKVGDDEFGRFLREVLVARGIATQGLILDAKESTTLAFVHLHADGDRSFSFYRKPGADTRLRPEEVDRSQLDAAIFHFGSLSLTHEPARSATLTALRWAKEKGMLISYDPNLRPPLWPSLEEAKRQILAVMDQADIVKISHEELEFLMGTGDLAGASAQLCREFGLTLLLVTLGKDGCYFRAGELAGLVPGFKVQAVDTTGAGDAFLGGLLFEVLRRDKGPKEWTSEELAESVRFANAVGALAVTRKGGIPAMPSLAQVEEFMSRANMAE
ncbi:PfkB family carbohydrate kinase [Candidatus Darwinibacter acetoxidans]